MESVIVDCCRITILYCKKELKISVGQDATHQEEGSHAAHGNQGECVALAERVKINDDRQVKSGWRLPRRCAPRNNGTEPEDQTTNGVGVKRQTKKKPLIPASFSDLEPPDFLFEWREPFQEVGRRC